MGFVTALSATGLALGLALTTAGSAAAEPITLPEDGVLQQRLEKFCAKVPDIIERAEKVQVRLAADASTRGSLAWLQARSDQADKADRDRIAKRLDTRLERRRERAAKLPERITKLKAAQQECTELGLSGAAS